MKPGLYQHLCEQIDSRLTGTPAERVGMFVGTPYNGTDDPASDAYEWSEDCWLDIDKTGICPWSRNTQSDNGLTAIGRRTLIGAGHCVMPLWTPVRDCVNAAAFVGSDDVTHVVEFSEIWVLGRTGLDPNDPYQQIHEYLNPGHTAAIYDEITDLPRTDTLIIKLAGDLPGTVTPVLLAPDDWATRITDVTGGRVHVAGCTSDQDQKVHAAEHRLYPEYDTSDGNIVYSPITNAITHGISKASRIAFARRDGFVMGDSGRAVFIVWEGKLVFLRTITYSDGSGATITMPPLNEHRISTQRILDYAEDDTIKVADLSVDFPKRVMFRRAS